jgi:isochorismate pyruvate lyase
LDDDHRDMAEPQSLADVRSRIDDLDTQLITLLARRQELVEAAAGFKRDEHAVRAPDRVEQVVTAVRAKATTAGLDPAVAEAVWRAMIAAFVNLELARHREATPKREERKAWFSVRCLFRLDAEAPATYEERMTLWRASSPAEAVTLAEAEAGEYATDVAGEYLGLAQVYSLSDEPAPGSELFSLLRDSRLPPAAYLDAFFDNGDERQSAARETFER